MAPLGLVASLVAAATAAATAAAAGIGASAAPPPSVDFLASWRAWHERRLAALRGPQGWLALVGLHWLEPGPNRIAGLPGVFEVSGGEATLRASSADGWRLGEAPVTARRLVSDAAKEPDRLRLGSRSAMVIDRGGRLALRVWDADSPVRAAFTGIETWPPDPRWRLTARWEAYPRPRAVEVPSVVGIPSQELAPGRAWFTMDGVEHALEPTLEGDHLFFVFKDRTAPRESYGGGRFLNAPMPEGGTVVLDFNRAVNPPCVFTPHATCPLPLPENVLPIRVEAGEKRWSTDH